jgi:hypothetical protein
MGLTPQVRSLAWVLVPAVMSGVAAVFSGAAQAEIIFSGTNIDVKVSDPVSVGMSPLKAITLTAVGKNGFFPNGFDSTRTNQGGTGITSEGDNLHQVGMPQINYYTPTNNPNISLLIDTHFLIGPPSYVSGTVLPSETMNIASAILGDTNGYFGNSLYGIFSLSGIPTSSEWDFAYIVAPEGTQVNLDFKIGAMQGSQSVRDEFIHSFTVTPEPSAFVLLAMGLLGMLVYARRLYL